jgi:putative two-component system response regulator
VVTAANGTKALEYLSMIQPDLIVSDIMMPGMDGFALLEQIHTHPDWITIPFLFLTALNDPESIQRGRELGVDDYLTKPFSPGGLAQAVRARLDRSRELEKAHNLEANLRMVLVMANAIEARDAYTGGHVERVAEYARDLARALGWSESQVKAVCMAAILHDIGKISVPDSILNKPTGLDPEEWEIIRSHPLRGCEILAPLKETPLVLDGVRHHHERYDGTGYPYHLAGENIPAIGRLLGIVDAYDAMTSRRGYSMALLPAEAFEQLLQGAGSQFDPTMVAVFLRLLQTKLSSPSRCDNCC